MPALQHYGHRGSSEGGQGSREVRRYPNPSVCKKMIVGILKEHRDRMIEAREVISEDEGLRRDATVRTLSLPTRESVDKIIRYETSIERQLYRAVSQLERLQRHDEPR